MRRSIGVGLLGLAALATTAVAQDRGPDLKGWEKDAEQAIRRAKAEDKLVLQFRLIGRFDRADC